MSETSGRRAKLRRFLAIDVWNAELSAFPGLRRLSIRFVRVSQLVLRGFREDDLPVHAAALTFSTLISLVPLLAIAFAVLKGLGAAQDATSRLNQLMSPMPEQFRVFVQQLMDIADKTNFGAIGWIGVVVLFVTVVQMLGSIENSFNRVWGVASSRTWFRKFTNYTSITVIVPVLIMAAFTMSATLQNEAIKHGLSETSFAYSTVLRLAPLATTWLAFVLLILFMPNTRVHRRPASLAAFVAALLWICWQKAYISLQISVANYNALYGTFASVPIFLLWLYVGWMIILFGSEIAFAMQNHGTYHMERAAAQASFRARIKMGLSALLGAARAFKSGDVGFDVDAFAKDHRVPVRLVNDLVGVFVRGGLLAELADTPGRYVVLKSPDKVTLAEVVGLVTHDGSAPEALGLSKADAAVEKAMAAVDTGLKGALGEKTLEQLLKNE